MAEQEIEKKLPEEVASRFDVGSLVKGQRNSVRLEMRSSIPKLVEKALENPSGTFQLVTDNQTAILMRIDENIMFLKEQLGELSNKAKPKKDDEDNKDDDEGLFSLSGNIPKLFRGYRRGGVKGLVKENLGGFFGDRIKKRLDKKAALAAASAAVPNLEMPDVKAKLPEGTLIKDPNLKGSQYVDPNTQKIVSKAQGEAAEKAGKIVSREEFKNLPKATPVAKPAVAPDLLKMPDVSPKAMVPEIEKVAGKGLIKKAIGKVFKSGAVKLLAKVIPGVGLLYGLGSGVARAMSGDLVGAAAEVGSGTASLFPGPGTAVAAATDIGLMARDVYQEVYGVVPDSDPLAKDRMSEVYTEVKDHVASYVSGDKGGENAPSAENITPRESNVEKVLQQNNADIPVTDETRTATIQPFAAAPNRVVPVAPNPEESTAQLNAAALSNIMDVKLAEFGNRDNDDRGTPSRPASPISTVPSFIAPPIPTALGVVAMRAQGLADVYPHPMSGPTMQNGDRGGETVFQ